MAAINDCKKSPPSLKLTYFNIQGVAERVRLAFVLAGVPFEDRRISFAEWPELKKACRYGQLPVLSVDGVDVPQSYAMSMLAADYSDSLLPEDPKARMRVNEVMGLAGDFDKAWLPCLYMGMRPSIYGYPEGSNRTPAGRARVKQLREAFAATDLPKYLQWYSDLLTEAGGAFFGGAAPSLADCHILPQLRAFTAGHIDFVPTDCLQAFPVVTAWIDRMLALPPIKKWYDDRAKADAAAKAAAPKPAPAVRASLSPATAVVAAATVATANWKLGLAAAAVLALTSLVKRK